jgi:hypothetical protein
MLTLASCAPPPAKETTPDSEAAATPETITPEAAPADETAPPMPMPGGYSEASLDNETVNAAKLIAVDEIYKREPQRAIVEKVEAQQQVVAGMNYRFTITMSGGSRYGVTVFHSLGGEMTVTDFSKLP